MMQNSMLVIVLSAVVEAMEFGGFAGMTALTMGQAKTARKTKEITLEGSNGANLLIPA